MTHIIASRSSLCASPLYCGDAILHAAYHNMAVCWASPRVLAPIAAHNTHSLPSSASTELLRFVRDPAKWICVPAIQRHTTMLCASGGRRQTWFDSSTTHPTAWRYRLFPTNRSVRAGREGRGEVASLRYAHPDLALHCSLLLKRLLHCRPSSHPARTSCRCSVQRARAELILPKHGVCDATAHT
jgi:hypothetical protein